MITKSRLTWTGHVWFKQGSIVKRVVEEDPMGKRPLGKPKLRWKDSVKKGVKKIEPEINRRETTVNRDRRPDLYLAVWS